MSNLQPNLHQTPQGQLVAKPEKPAEYPSWVARCDIKGSVGFVLNPVFSKKVQGQKHPGRWGIVKGLSPVTRNLCCQSARGNRSGAVRYFPEAVRPRGNTAAPDRFPRADWQHKFLVTGLNPDYNMVTVRVKHRKVPNRGFQHHGRHFVLRRFWRFPLWFTPPPTLKI